MYRGRGWPVAAGVLTLALAACTGAQATPTPGDGGTTVEVTLQEWAVVPAEMSAPAGQVTFVITNEGPDDVHEFVVIRTDLAPGDLPTDATGTVVEGGEGMEVVDEVEDLPVGDTAELAVELAAGSYVLVCNIYDEDEAEAHYQMGMRIGFTVE